MEQYDRMGNPVYIIITVITAVTASWLNTFSDGEAVSAKKVFYF